MTVNEILIKLHLKMIKHKGVKFKTIFYEHETLIRHLKLKQTYISHDKNKKKGEKI